MTERSIHDDSIGAHLRQLLAPLPGVTSTTSEDGKSEYADCETLELLGVPFEEIADEIASICTQAHLQVAEGQLSDAVEALRTMLDVATTAQRRYTALRITLEFGVAPSASIEEDRASSILLRALKTGEQASLLQCWVDASRACNSLLERVVQRLPHTSSSQLAVLDADLRTILAHQSADRPDHQCTPRPGIHVRARLSTRERAVLALIAKGQSNKRAAQTLRVTPETIKSHLKRAFVKLGARTRAEAVSRASEMGQLTGVLLPTAMRGQFSS
jgi:LuxR family maltose regulon positive regulatory protein